MENTRTSEGHGEKGKKKNNFPSWRGEQKTVKIQKSSGPWIDEDIERRGPVIVKKNVLLHEADGPKNKRKPSIPLPSMQGKEKGGLDKWDGTGGFGATEKEKGGWGSLPPVGNVKRGNGRIYGTREERKP